MDIQRIELTPRTVLGLHEVVRPADLTEFFGRAFGMTNSALQELGVQAAGPPVALYRSGPEQEDFDVIAGLPVAGVTAAPPGLELAVLPAGQAVAAIHLGGYESLEKTYAEVNTWMHERDLSQAEPIWEEYLVGPDAHPDPADWRTRVVFPLAQEVPDFG